MADSSSPKRRANGQLMPGHTANPTGRPRIVQEVQQMTREHAPVAFARVVALVQNPDARIALAAAQVVLGYAWGKPMQQVQTEVTKIDAGALYLAALKATNGLPGDGATVIEGTAEETGVEEPDNSDETGLSAAPIDW